MAANPRSSASACASRWRRSASSAGSACGLAAQRVLEPEQRADRTPLRGVEAGQRHQAVAAGMGAVVGIEPLARLAGRGQPSQLLGAHGARRPVGASRSSTATKRCAWSVSAAPSSDTSSSGARSSRASSPATHRQRGQQAGGEVGQRQPAEPARHRVARARLRQQQPGQGLGDQVVGRALGVRAGAAEGRHGHHHAARVDARGRCRGRGRSAAHARAGSCARARPRWRSARRCARGRRGLRRSSATERLPRLSAWK